MSFIIKHKASGMYVEYINIDIGRIYLCEDGLEAFQFSDYETAQHALKMLDVDLDNYVIEEYEE